MCVRMESEREIGVRHRYRGYDIDVIFFFNDTATTEIYTLSLHDALPIFVAQRRRHLAIGADIQRRQTAEPVVIEIQLKATPRSEEHTSELQSH